MDEQKNAGPNKTAKTKAPTLRVERIYENAPLPTKPKTDTDSGFDVVAHNVSRIYAHFGGNGERVLENENLELKFTDTGVFELQSGERALIGTGLKMTVGPGYELQVRPRSGLALKNGLTVVNSPGTIDEQYRDEVCVILMNTSRQTQYITLGDRIAQVVPAKVELLEISEEKLDDNTVRGKDGFGSTSNRRDFDKGIVAPIDTNVIRPTTPFNIMG